MFEIHGNSANKKKKTSVAMQDKRLMYREPKMKSSCFVLLIDGVEKLELKARSVKWRPL